MPGLRRARRGSFTAETPRHGEGAEKRRFANPEILKFSAIPLRKLLSSRPSFPTHSATAAVAKAPRLRVSAVSFGSWFVLTALTFAPPNF